MNNTTTQKNAARDAERKISEITFHGAFHFDEGSGSGGPTNADPYIDDYDHYEEIEVTEEVHSKVSKNFDAFNLGQDGELGEIGDYRVFESPVELDDQGYYQSHSWTGFLVIWP